MIVKNIFKKNKNIVKSIFLFFFIFLSVYLFDVGCIFRKFFHISCPSCGLTRAWLSFLSLNPMKAFYFHPLFWSIPIILYLFVVFDTTKSYQKILIYFLSFLFLVVYFIRLIFFRIP
ncbi:MAG: DUF2752 domain-containing protein [Breznakia sp.]